MHARAHTSFPTLAHTSSLCHGLHQSSGNGCQQRNLPFLCVPELAPCLSHSGLQVTDIHQLIMLILSLAVRIENTSTVSPPVVCVTYGDHRATVAVVYRTATYQWLLYNRLFWGQCLAMSDECLTISWFKNKSWSSSGKCQWMLLLAVFLEYTWMCSLKESGLLMSHVIDLGSAVVGKSSCFDPLDCVWCLEQKQEGDYSFQRQDSPPPPKERANFSSPTVIC
jgi:hypothetical protein